MFHSSHTELALIANKPRAASAHAVGVVTCASKSSKTYHLHGGVEHVVELHLRPLLIHTLLPSTSSLSISPSLFSSLFPSLFPFPPPSSSTPSFSSLPIFSTWGRGIWASPWTLHGHHEAKLPPLRRATHAAVRHHSGYHWHALTNTT